MKTLTLCFALLLSACLLCAADPAPSIKVTLDFHDSYLDVTGRNVPPTLKADGGKFHVILENTSDQPIWLAPIDDEFYPNLSIEITSEDGKTSSSAVAMYADGPHRPMFRLLRPKEIAVVDVQYIAELKGTGDRPEGTYAFIFPPPGETRHVSIRAVFDKTPYDGYADLSKLNLGAKWTGKTASTPVKVILQGRL